jgi:CxxC motif-containing protein
MLREFTCLVCPRGCLLEADTEKTGDARVNGAACAKGLAYAVQELDDPRRTFSTSVRVLSGEAPLVPVRLTRPVPRASIGEALSLIHAITLTAPVEAGQVVLPDVLGFGGDAIAVRSVKAGERKAEF